MRAPAAEEEPTLADQWLSSRRFKSTNDSQANLYADAEVAVAAGR
jgi:hypothetical protein